MTTQRKLILVFALALVATPIFSQRREITWREGEVATTIHKNEVKLNLPLTIFGLYPEITYERLLNADISVGASAGVSLNGGNDYSLNYNLTPYLRWFFGGNSKALDKAAAGFFIELNSSLFSWSNLEKDEINYDHETGAVKINSNNKNDAFGAGLGIGIGWKYLTKRNWVGEIFTGVGRDFVNEKAYPRIGILIGKRF